MKPGDIYLGNADHVWKGGQRPEVVIVNCGINFVTYKYIDCGVLNELHSLEVLKFNISFEPKPARTK